MIWWMSLLTTCILHLELHFTDHWHTQTSVLSLLQTFPGNGFYREKFHSFPHSGPLVTAARAELLSTDNSTNWVLGWRPFHTNLLVFSSHADFQLSTELSHSPTSYLSLHSTELLTTLYSGTRLTLLTTFRIHCYSPTISLPLHRNGFCLFSYCVAMAIV
jgi:hypothetical protein